MRLIEKECPNCGAGVSFTREDTTCKCEYCKREFEIERDTEKKNLNDQFSLSEFKTPLKIFSYFTFGTFLTHAVSIGIVFIIIIIILFGSLWGLNSSNKDKALIKSTSELTSTDYSRIDLHARVMISKETTTTTGGYVNKGKIKREKIYVVYNDKTNYVIPVYKVVYTYFSNSDDTHTVYIPISYKRVRRRGNSISLSLDDGFIATDEYYFNDNDYTYGYSDLDTLYNKVIKNFEKEFKIEEK